MAISHGEEFGHPREDGGKRSRLGHRARMVRDNRVPRRLAMSPTTRTRKTNPPALSGVLRMARLDRWSTAATPVFYLAAMVMVASLLLGGGTRGGFASDAVLQLIAIPALLFSLWSLFEQPLTRQMRIALWFCLAIAALPLLQLVPLPPFLWTLLPNREPSVAGLETIGHSLPWMPISVSPEATWLAALSLIPPLAIFLGTLLLSYRERLWLSLSVLAVGIVSVFIGLIQVAKGPQSPWRFFVITNPTEAVGFFANRNHFAAFIYALLLFAVPWTLHAASAIGRGGYRRQHESQFDVVPILGIIAGFTVLVIFLAGEMMARSRAGLFLTILALFGALALGLFNQRDRLGLGSKGISRKLPDRFLTTFTPTKLLIAAVALTVTFSLQYALYRVQERFEVDPSEDARAIFVPNTIEAAKAYMPFGAGLGTFVLVYPLFEKPEDTLANTFANRAHNDVVEAWLESGIFALILMGMFLTWFVLRSVAIWRSRPPPGASELDWSLARAATIVIGLVLVHSFVDYPLRTGAMMAIVAFACALLVEPAVASGEGFELDLAAQPRQRQRSPAKRAPAPALGHEAPPSGQPGESAEVPAPSQGQRWGAGINWPKEWSRSSEQSSGDQDPPDPSKPKAE